MSVSPPIPDVTGDDGQRIAARDFPAGTDRALAILHDYGTETWEQQPDRVRLAALKLAAGDLERLRSAIETARRDFRDVLVPAECPEYWGSIDPSESVSPEVMRRVIEADWRQYQDWLSR